MIEVVFVLALMIAAIAYVSTPVLRGPRVETPGWESTDDAAAARDAALAALIDIDEERDSGKLSDADFDQLRAVYEVEAVEAIRRLDAIGAPTGAIRPPTGAHDDALEAEIAAMRAKLTCSECGTVRTPGAPCPTCDA